MNLFENFKFGYFSRRLKKKIYNNVRYKHLFLKKDGIFQKSTQVNNHNFIKNNLFNLGTNLGFE